MATFNLTRLSRLLATNGLLVLSLLTVSDMNMTYASNDDWDKFLLKYLNRRRQGMHQLWESRTDGEYFKLCKILIEFPDKFREYYSMNIRTFDYIMDSVKDVLQGYSDFIKCNEAEEKLTVALRYILDIAVRIKINYICKILNAVIIQCNLKGN